MIGRGAWIRRDARRNELIVVRGYTVDFKRLAGLEMLQSIY
jgi:hypothetical protein